MPEIYLGNQNLKAAGVNVEYTQEQIQEYIILLEANVNSVGGVMVKLICLLK